MHDGFPETFLKGKATSVIQPELVESPPHRRSKTIYRAFTHSALKYIFIYSCTFFPAQPRGSATSHVNDPPPPHKAVL